MFFVMNEVISLAFSESISYNIDFIFFKLSFAVNSSAKKLIASVIFSLSDEVVAEFFTKMKILFVEFIF